MAYILSHGNKPYFVSSKGVFPCSISAYSVFVDFENPIKKRVQKENSFYTEDELRHKLGLRMVEAWDEKTQTVIKKSNRVYSTVEVIKPIENKLDKEASK